MKVLAATHQDWLLFDQDECWFSRFAQPTAHAWAAHRRPLRLVQHQAGRAEEQKALACFGAVRQGTDQVYLDFCQGQPNSEQAWAFVQRLLEVARQEAKRVVVIIWDHASWHKSKRLKEWIRNYNRQAKLEGDVRLLTFLLPRKSPWLNPIEPRWVHAKRQVCEPDGDISSEELERRLCSHFHTQPLSSMAIQHM